MMNCLPPGRLLTALPLVAALIFSAGCGDEPPEMPAPAPNIGSLEVSSSILLEPGLYFRPDSMTVLLNGEVQGIRSNPTLFEGLYAGPVRVRTLLKFRGEDFPSPVNRFEVLFGRTVKAAVDTKVGAVVVTSPVEFIPGRPEYPDSLGIVLDGDTLAGYHTNPDTLSLVVEGSHTIATFAVYQGQEFQGDPAPVTVAWGGMSNVTIELNSGGVMLVNAAYNSSPVAEFSLRLDGMDFGSAPGPRTIANVPAGTHRLTVYAFVDTCRIEGWASGLAVVRSETTYVDVDLQLVSPFEGFHAPSFDGEDVDGNKYCLAEHFGQVVFMYFFEST